MSSHQELPHETPRQRGRISSFVLRLRTQKAKSLATSKGTKMACLIHKLPPELREEIFKPLLVNWNGKTPSLIKALRSDTKLYHEALEIFYKQNSFTFHKENDWSFGDMTKEAVLSIERVKIVVETDIMKTGLWKLGGSKNEENLLTPIVPTSLSDATNIREVILEFKKDHHWWEHTVIPPFIAYGNISYSSNYFLVSFQKLRRVELIVPQPWFTPVNWWTVHHDRELRYREGIKLVNVRLGVLGKMLTVPALQIQEGDQMQEDEEHALNAHEEWFWQAEEGTFLKEPNLPAYERDKIFF